MWKRQRLTDSELSVKFNQLPHDKTFEKVYLRYNCLESVPPFHHHTQFEYVEQLYLSDNSIVKLNRENLPHGVKWLDMSANLVNELCDLTECHSLEKLRLARNRIHTLNPHNIPANIQLLDISHNQLTDTPDVSQCHQLCQLHLSDNQVTELDPDKLPVNIEEVLLQNNKLTVVRDFTQHKKLQKLDLRGNLIIKIYDINRDMSSWWIDRLDERFFEDKTAYQLLVDGQLNVGWLTQPPSSVFKRGVQSVLTYFRDMTLSKRVRHSRKRYMFFNTYLHGIL